MVGEVRQVVHNQHSCMHKFTYPSIRQAPTLTPIHAAHGIVPCADTCPGACFHMPLLSPSPTLCSSTRPPTPPLQVIQETEDGGDGDVIEDEESDDPLARAVKVVTSAAASAKNKLSGLAGSAYRALGREAPGADVTGQGAPIKDLAEGAKETAALHEEEMEQRRRVPAPPDALRPAPPPAGGDGSRGPFTEGESGYESAEAHVPASVEEPTIAGEARPGLLTRAAEATGELATSAADTVKHAAAVVTGSAEEQRPPVDRLAELQASITEMEVERAEDVEFQKASKRLGM